MPIIQTNGQSIYYELFGPAQAEAIVFLSGLTGDHKNWTLQVNSFQDRYRCLCFDWRDTGLSGISPLEEYGLSDMAEDVVGLIEGLGLGRVHLVGLSMGGAVAQLIALEYPERVATLTLASSFVVAPGLAELPPSKRTRGNLRQAIAASRHDVTARLSELRLSVLVVAGERDRTTLPETQRAYAALLPNAQFHLIERAGHTVQVEKAGEFNRTLAAFLEGLRTEVGIYDWNKIASPRRAG